MTRLPRLASGVARGADWRRRTALVDPDDLGVLSHGRDQLVGIPDVLGLDPHVAVRDDVILAVAIVDERFEDLDLLAGDLRAAQAADELLALAAEHAARDDFDPAVLRRLANNIHRQTRD